MRTNLGRLYILMGQNLQAVVELERSLNILHELHGNQHALTMATLSTLADLYAKLPARRYDAVKCYEDLIEARRTKFGPGDSRGWFGRRVERRGEWSGTETRGEKKCRSELKASSSLFPVASPLSKLAQLHRIMGNNVEAMAPLEEAIRIKQSNLGANHPELAPELLSLAEVNMSLVSLRETRSDGVMFVHRALLMPFPLVFVAAVL